MPYIKRGSRAKLNQHIDALAEAISTLAAKEKGQEAFAGYLNYSYTRLALKVMPEKRYWTIALVTGVFKNAADEFYRRVAVPYENAQRKKNGDVYR